MDVLYKIIGIRMIGRRICLTVKHVEGDKELDAGKIMGNLKVFMNDMKQEAVSNQNPDQISITSEEYDKGCYNLGDVISVSIRGKGGGFDV